MLTFTDVDEIGEETRKACSSILSTLSGFAKDLDPEAYSILMNSFGIRLASFCVCYSDCLNEE